MTTHTAADGGSPMAVVTSAFFLKALALGVLFVLFGFAAPALFKQDEFVGVLVGMSLSLGIIILAVLGISVLGTVVRSSLR